MKSWLVVAMCCVACDHRAHVTSCQADLHGVWIAPGNARWMILDQGPDWLEVYPLFPDGDSARPEIVVAAPRVIDLHPDGTGLAGTIAKRYMQRADSCEARVPVQVTSCADDTLEVALPDVHAPLSFAPCVWPPPSPRHVEHWHRE
jgi:hypothetical protein